MNNAVVMISDVVEGSLLAGNLSPKVVQAESKVAWVSVVAVCGRLDGGWIHVARGVGQAVGG